MEILKGRIISVISAKGGSGATFISSNLAVSLAKTGKTVLLDLEENSSSILFDLEFEKATEKLLAANLNPEAFSSLLPVHSSGLYCAVLESNDKALLNKLSDTLCFGFQNIVFDAGTLLANAECLLENSSAVFLVVNPDIVSLRAAGKTLARLASFHLDLDKVTVILNKASEFSGIDEKTVEQNLGKKVICSVPFEMSAAACINRGQPLMLAEPASPAAAALCDLVKLIKTLQPCNKDSPDSGNKNNEEEIKEKVYKKLLKTLAGMDIELDSFTDGKKKEELKGKVQSILENIFASDVNEIKSKGQRERLINLILQEALGLGPLEDLLEDPGVTEIMVNGRDRVYVERRGKISLTEKKFRSNKQLLSCIERIVAPIGRRIDESIPVVDARLADGSRVNAIIPPLSLKGPALTIRKFARERLTVKDLISAGSITKDAAEFLRVCILARKNMVISGGTGSGKTTLLNIISSFIPPDERIITIEDSAELNLPQDHVITLETRPPNIEGCGEVTIRDLVKNSLRMRPDRIVVGECRGGEALDMLQAMNTGHDGSLTTLHSNSPRDTLSRLETMVLMSGMNLPLKAVREQIASAVDLIIHQERFKDGSRKITHITEVAGMEGDVITTQEIFSYIHTRNAKDALNSGKLTVKGIVPGFIDDIIIADKTFNRAVFLEPI